MTKRVSISVDMEPDCPPFLSGYRGVTEGLPGLLDLLQAEKIPATFFTTGELARSWPDAIRDILDAGHELGCHGDTHRSFQTLAPEEARREIHLATDTLSAFTTPVSFRAPYLEFPERYLPLLADSGYALDSSVAKYKYPFRAGHRNPGLRRVPVSATSSLLRLPEWIRNPFLERLEDPVILYVHPWEFVDLTRERLRWDCRFRTGPKAIRCLRSVLRKFKQEGAHFYRMDNLPT